MPLNLHDNILMNKLDIHLLGSLEYAEGLRLQKEFHADILKQERNPSLLLLEHFPVITLGKNANRDMLLSSEKELKQESISLHHIERGGEATAHEPGQLVIYPLINLRHFSYGARVFVNKLEDCVLDLLREYKIEARRDDKFPGVWVDSEKICSVGIRISQGVSTHGLALNVSNDLRTFSKIIPCGIQDCRMVTVSELLGKTVSTEEIAKTFIEIFCRNFHISEFFIFS